MRGEPTVPVVLAGSAAFLNLYATQPLLPLLARTFHASTFQVGLTVTAPTVAVAVFAPVVGRLADTIGLRRVIVGSSFLLAAATALSATAGSLWQLIAWRFVLGAVTPGIFAGTVAYIHEMWPASRVGRATAAYMTGTIVGGFSGRALAGLIAADLDWHLSFAVLGAIAFGIATALLVSMPSDRSARLEGSRYTSVDRASHTSGGRASDTSGGRASFLARRSLGEGGSGAPPRKRGFSRAARELFRNRQLIATYALGFCVLFTNVAMFTYVTFHLAAPPYNLSTAALGWLFAVYLLGVIVTPLGGRWIDKYGHRVGLAAAMAIGAAGALLTLLGPLPAIIAGLAFTSTGVFVAQTTTSSYIGAVTTGDRGLAVGLYSTFYYTGGSVGASAPAVVWNGGGWPACVALVVGVQCAGALIALTTWSAPALTAGEARRLP
jgi:predicted MFS family arabinose efflux permease